MMPIDPGTPSGALLALLPEVLLTGWALVTLLVTAWKHRTGHDSRFVGTLSLVGYAFALAATAWMASRGARAEGLPQMIALDGFRFASDALLLTIAMGVTILSLRWLERQGILAPEYYVLLMLATVGMMLLAGAADLITLFLGLEVMSVAVYVLAGYDRTRRASAEAALKYFLIGAFASGFLLYGIALIYGATGQFNLALIGAQLSATPPTLMAKAGLALLLVGFGFKIAAVPFHSWAPDVYEGAPTPITAFMASGVKAAAFLALARLLAEAFPSYVELWRPVLFWLAVVTMLVGNLVALAQQSIKRMLAYSAVAHAGYLLMALWAHSDDGTAAVLVYLLAYSITTVAAFGILASIERAGARTVLISDLEGLYAVRPFASLGMSICMLSLLGFPGTFGFIGKWYLITAALAQGEVILPVVAMIASGISIGYYLPVVLAMTLKPTRTRQAHQTIRIPGPAKVALAVCVAAILVLGIWAAVLHAARALCASAARVLRYGDSGESDDYTRIIHDDAFARLQGHLDDARARGLEVETVDDLRDQPLEALDPLAREFFNQNSILAAIEGGGTSLGGPLFIAADIPLLFTINFRLIQQIGGAYGFPLRRPEFQPLVIAIYNVAASGSQASKHAAVRELSVAAAAFAHDTGYKGRRASGTFREQNRHVPRELAKNLAARKLGQLIPVAGAAVGAGVNYWFTDQTAKTATMLFRSLYLERKERL